jgi:hypothetical protein
VQIQQYCAALATATASLFDLLDFPDFGLSPPRAAIGVGDEIFQGTTLVVRVDGPVDAHEISNISPEDQNASSKGFRELPTTWSV